MRSREGVGLGAQQLVLERILLAAGGVSAANTGEVDIADGSDVLEALLPVPRIGAVGAPVVLSDLGSGPPLEDVDLLRENGAPRRCSLLAAGVDHLDFLALSDDFRVDLRVEPSRDVA